MRKAHGFTLIEALVTLVLVLLGLTGAARLQASLLAASAEAKARDEATAMALDQLAAFQTLFTYTDYRDAITPGSTQQQGLLYTYAIDWDVHHTLAPDYKYVDITVSWPADNPVQTLQIQSLVPGLDLPRFARQQLPP
ncbi:MAG: prepilin-type N-terminal cleavage/methylation domain-containing protein [Gammaproteobacteria bacterium]|nr:prepilin-type N-terminal cleavage/methylation domain-containing protein [Gammaproteobacteria bacterium]